MNRFRIYDFSPKERHVRFKIFLFVLLFLFINHYSLFIIQVSAADSTASGGLIDKLNQLKEEIASKASVLKKEITQELQNKAFVGVVKTKSDSSITIATKAGTNIISINQDTVYQDTTKKQKNFSAKSIKEEDNIAGLGDVDDTGVLVARKVVLLPLPTSHPKTILWGQILSVSDKLITIRDKDSKTISLSTSADTDFQKNGDEIAFKNLSINDYVIATGSFGDGEDTKKVGTLDTVFIYVTTSNATPKPKEASPSATVKPTSTPGKASKPSSTPKT